MTSFRNAFKAKVSTHICNPNLVLGHQSSPSPLSYSPSCPIWNKTSILKFTMEAAKSSEVGAPKKENKNKNLTQPVTQNKNEKVEVH